MPTFGVRKLHFTGDSPRNSNFFPALLHHTAVLRSSDGGCPHLASESYILLVTHHEIATISQHYSITPQCSDHLTAIIIASASQTD